MSELRNQSEYHRADPAYRRQMLVFLAVTTVGGCAALVALQFWLARLGARAGQGDLLTYELWLHRLLAGLCLVLAATGAGFSYWLYRMARATQSERRWPPASARTSADVRVRYLTSADSLVLQMKGVAIALALLALGLAAWAIWLLRSA